MSLHPPRVLTREQVLLASSKPISPTLKLVFLVLAIIGAVVFVAGVFFDADRAWSAFHANWLFWASLSHAGVVFVAVQRITTARWSRAVIRFMEGYVAFLPVAFLFLLLTLFVGRGHVFPWTHEAYPVPEKATYYNGTFLTIRDIVIFGLMTLMGWWYIWTSLRLDIGRIPEGGAPWARKMAGIVPPGGSITLLPDPG